LRFSTDREVSASDAVYRREFVSIRYDEPRRVVDDALAEGYAVSSTTLIVQVC